MTAVTEAAVCATPAVVTDIAGHRDAVDATAYGTLAALVARATDEAVPANGRHARRRRSTAR
jgi:hypothetical protein